MTVCLLLWIGWCASGADVHLEQNPLYRQMVQEGLSFEGKEVPRLPEPDMPDGLTAQQQREVIGRLVRGRVSVDEFLRRSVSAPNALVVGPIEELASGLRVRRVDLYFAAYGRLSTLRNNPEWVDRVFRRGDEDAHVLSAAELADRHVTLEDNLAERTRFVHGSGVLLDRVQVILTTRTVWSQSDQSALAATVADARFNNDPEFPNQWRPVRIAADGERQPGEPQPYLVSASYWKATQLVEPAEAIFIELHTLFEQPKAWFGGVDLLRSKLPLAVQTELRSFRRRLEQARESAAP